MTSQQMYYKKEFVKWLRRNDAMPLAVIAAVVVVTIIILAIVGMPPTDAYLGF